MPSGSWSPCAISTICEFQLLRQPSAKTCKPWNFCSSAAAPPSSRSIWRMAMGAHDPMWDLQGLIDQPVPPDPHFTETLRQQLLDNLSTVKSDGDNEHALLIKLEQAGLARGSHHHLVDSPRKTLTVLFELVLVAAIVIGANAAIDHNWGQASLQPPSPERAHTAQSTHSAVLQNSMPNPPGAPVVTPEARTISPAFAPTQTAAPASQLMWS